MRLGTLDKGQDLEEAECEMDFETYKWTMIVRLMVWSIWVETQICESSAYWG